MADDEIFGLLLNFLVDLGLRCMVPLARFRNDHLFDRTLTDVGVSISHTLVQRVQNGFLGTSLGQCLVARVLGDGRLGKSCLVRVTAKSHVRFVSLVSRLCRLRIVDTR